MIVGASPHRPETAERAALLHLLDSMSGALVNAWLVSEKATAKRLRSLMEFAVAVECDERPERLLGIGAGAHLKERLKATAACYAC